MARPTNTLSTYEAVKQREDVAPMIENVDPFATPIYSSIKKLRRHRTNVEWQQDVLEDATPNNAHIEGDDETAMPSPQPETYSNTMQILKKTVRISNTTNAVELYGRSNEMAYQFMKHGKSLRTDIETIISSDQAKRTNEVAPTNTDMGGRRMATLGAWLHTNVVQDAGATLPKGDGTDVRRGGAATALTQDKMDSAMENVWESSDTDMLSGFLGGFQHKRATAFTGSNNQRSQIDARMKKVYRTIEVYVNEFGQVAFMKDRFMPKDRVYLLDTSKWCIGFLRRFHREELSRTGDSRRWALRVEMTLESRNEKSSSAIYNLTMA